MLIKIKERRIYNEPLLQS